MTKIRLVEVLYGEKNGAKIWKEKWREMWFEKWREIWYRRMAGKLKAWSCYGVEAAPALVFFLRWKCGLVKVFMAARRPTLLILRVRDTDRLSFIPSMVERRLALYGICFISSLNTSLCNRILPSVVAMYNASKLCYSKRTYQSRSPVFF
jgi:hypothetical protein